ncbi:hypothetical protein lerEdw1_006367 [Lerista edwardsae]|nr:hypothetical protein lerEdw1_006367 [Lerista edwardsae]
MGFIQEIAKFHHLLDDVTISAEGCPVGYALYFFGYNVNHGRMLYLENLFVASEFRGKGIGQQLLARVAEIALAAGCVEMKFVTMEWNRLAKEFYVRLGAHDTTESEELHCMELGREALQRLVRRGQRTGSANPCSGQQPQA